MKKRLCSLFMVLALLITTVVPVSAATVTINKNSITIQSGDTYQLQVMVDGRVAQATAWGSSDTNVAEVSQTGVVTGKAAGSAIVTAMVAGQSVECLVSVVKKSQSSTTRYNVLILDTSGSVKGTPLKRQKEAAKRFCKTVLGSSGKNYLAIVTLNTSPKVVCNFTDNQKTLEKKINGMKAKGGTNINMALQKAGTLLGKVKNGSNVMKNVILCSDGLPESGSKSAGGRYKKKDHKYYKYANAAYKTDVKLKNKKYFIYALGFFHNSTSKDLKFGKRLMKDLASKDKYYVVTNTKDVDKVLNDIAKKITKTVMNKTSIVLYEGETYQLNVQVNGVTKKAQWKSNNSAIASVNSSGKVTAKKAGTTVVTGTVNGKSVTCKVVVKKKKAAPSKPSLSLSHSKINVYVNKTVQLKATITGKSKKGKWSSADKSIATVDQTGKVKGIKVGKTTVTVTANGIKRTCEVNVIVKHPTYSQYFMVKPTKSHYGNQKINEYGVRLVTNEDAVITKCAVYIEKSGSTCRRTIACKGNNITYATYVPYLAMNGKIIYDGLTTYNINTFSLRSDYNGVWSRSANYSLITANLTDANGRQLAISSTGVAGKNTKIFYDKSKMIEWMNK